MFFYICCNQSVKALCIYTLKDQEPRNRTQPTSSERAPYEDKHSRGHIF